MSKIYILNQMGSSWIQSFHAEAFPNWPNPSTVKKCPDCETPIYNFEAYTQKEYTLDIFGNRLGDRVPIPFGPGVYSKAFVDSFLSSGLTGVKAFSPISFTDVRQKEFLHEPIGQYLVPRITEFGPLNWVKSGFKVQPACTACQQPSSHICLPHPIVLDIQTPSEDVFSIKGLNWVFVSEKFKAFCEAERFTNFLFNEIPYFNEVRPSGIDPSLPVDQIDEYDFEKTRLQIDDDYRKLVSKIKIIGVHKYPYTMDEIHAELKYVLENWPKEQAEREVETYRQQYDCVYLVEISIPQDLWFNFGFLFQGSPSPDLGTGDRLVPYEPRLIDSDGYRWAFFLHCIRLAKPEPHYGYEQLPFNYLGAEFEAPQLTDLPPYLTDMKYEWPS